MPVRQLRPRRSADHKRLAELLANEWRQADSTLSEPVILEEFNNAGDLIHVYVVWSAWAHLDRAERGEIITDAAEQRYDPTDLASLSVAMGLTPVEADQANISWK
jgi:hypothetical protein